jgi:hypothetical protein
MSISETSVKPKYFVVSNIIKWKLVISSGYQAKAVQLLESQKRFVFFFFVDRMMQNFRTSQSYSYKYRSVSFESVLIFISLNSPKCLCSYERLLFREWTTVGRLFFGWIFVQKTHHERSKTLIHAI